MGRVHRMLPPKTGEEDVDEAELQRRQASMRLSIVENEGNKG